MGFKEIILGIVFVSLFTLAMVTFGTQMAINNNAEQNIIDDPSISGVNDTLSGYLDDIQSTAQTQRETLENQEAQGSVDEGFSLTSIVGVVWTFFSTGISGYNIILTLIEDVLGIPALVLNLILGAFIIIVLLLSWRVFKVGGT